MVGSSQTDLPGVTDPRTWESTHRILDPIRPHCLGFRLSFPAVSECQNQPSGGSDGAFGLTNALGISGSADRASAQKRKGQASESPTAKPVISLKALARACPAVKDWCDDDPFRSEGAFLHWSETIKSVVGISDD